MKENYLSMAYNMHTKLNIIKYIYQSVDDLLCHYNNYIVLNQMHMILIYCSYSFIWVSNLSRQILQIFKNK